MSGVPNNSNAPVVMDARKFVRHINNGAASRLKVLEEAVAKLGQNVGKKLRLTTVDANTLIYEDVEQNRYYVADVKKAKNRRLTIDNIRPIQLVEEDKASTFQKNVQDLVESVCDGDFTAADRLFDKIAGQRFRSRVIPESGWITLRDGVSRHIPVSTRIVKEDHVSNIIRLFTEAVKDDVVVDKGRIIRGTINEGEQKFLIPINEYTRRRLTAFKMRDAASNAYKSPAFSDMVVESAALVCEGKITDAIKLAGKFFKEEQEFCLLDQTGMRRLVESAMATKCHFNSVLASDVATLMFKTNMKINQASILEAWTKMAQKSEHAGLLNNVSVLSESTNFEADYNKFLNLVFNEEMDIQQARAKAYRTTLRVISSVLPDLEEGDEDVTTSVDELNELIEKLSGPEPDTDAVLQAEELLAGISDSLVDAIQDLSGFDQMPGEEEAEGEGEEEAEGELVPLPDVGEGEEEEEAEGGEEAMAPPPPPPGEEEGGPPMPPMEGRLSPVERMGVETLLEELESWRVHGDTYLAEDGYSSCYDDLQRYIKRCIEIGPKANTIRENFEDMRDRMVQTGDEVLDDLDESDPYSESVMAALNGSDRLLESSDPNDPERDPHFWDKKKKVANEGRINLDYRHTFLEGEQPWEMSGGLSDASGLRMDDLRGDGGVASKTPTRSDGRKAGGSAAGYDARQRGNGVAKKGAKPVDGRKGEHSTSGAAGGELRMDDLQGGGGVQSQGLGSTDGRKGHSTSSQKSESTVKAHGGHPSTDLSMGSDFQGKGGVVPKSLTKGNGAGSEGASAAKNYKASGGPGDAGTDMAKDFQGRDGVEDDSLDSDPHKGQGKVGSDAGSKKAPRKGDMSNLQGSGGVAESITPERIAELLDLMEALECGCPGKGSCKNNSECGCNKDCACRAGDTVSEESQKPWEKDSKDSDESKDSDSSGCDCGKVPCECPPQSEDQYKGPTRKYKNRGFKKSAIAPMSEGKVAAFVGDADGVADAVDKILSQMGGEDLDVAGLGDEDLGMGMETEADMPEEPPMGPEPEEPAGEEELGDALDSALSGEDEMPEGEEEEMVPEGADEGPDSDDSDDEEDDDEAVSEG